MPRICTICRHPKRDEIKQALLADEPLRDIAKRYRTSPAALCRHQKHDLPATSVKASDPDEQMQAGTLFERFQNLQRATAAILEEARFSQNHAVALQAISAWKGKLRLKLA